MSTRSRIAIYDETTKTFRSVYCHSDGYPQNPGVGSELFQHYTDRIKVEALVALGDLSSIAPEIGDKHGFDQRSQGFVTAYHRDRDEEWEQVMPDEDKTIKSLGQTADNSGGEYLYVFRDGVWKYSPVGSNGRVRLRALTAKVCGL